MAIELFHQNGGNIVIGPFLSDTDGKTPLTGLTIANTDIKLFKKNASALVNKNSGGATHLANGLYRISLDATDTNQDGLLLVFCHMSGALPVRAEVRVLEQYYPKYRAFWGTLTWIDVGAGATTTTIPIASLAFPTLSPSTVNGAYVGMLVVPAFGMGDSAISRVTAYNGATNVITVDPPLTVAPSSGDYFLLYPGAPGTLADGAITAAKLASNAITSAKLADGAITAGKLASDSITAAKIAADAVTKIQNGLALATALQTVDDNVDTLIARLTATRAGYLDNLNSGAPLSAAAVDAILDEVVEGTVTLRQAIRLFLSVMTGKSSGGDTTSVTFRDIADTKNRLAFTVDANGNRTAVGTRDGT